MTLNEQIEDIVRRSCVNTKKTSIPNDPCDDKLISIFSKQNKGKEPKSKERKQEDKIRKLLRHGEKQIQKDKHDARKTYIKIREEYGKLKQQNKQLFEEILDFYNKLTK